MDGQHNYEINLKKDDLFINLSSDDVYFISKQMDKWFRILLDDSYIPVSLPPRASSVSMPAESTPQATFTEPVPAPVYQPAPQPEAIPIAEPVPVAVEPPPVQQPQPVEAQPQFQPETQAPEPQFVRPEQPEPVAVSAARPPLPEFQEQAYAQPQQAQLPLSQPEPSQAPMMTAPAPALDAAVQDDFEAVMDSLMKDLEEESGPVAAPIATAVHAQQTVPASAPVQGGNGRASVDSIASLSDLCDRSHAGSSEDYLLLSAYYLTYFESQEKFSLKNINSMLVKSGLTPVNHSVLEVTLGRGYLSMVPDLTGMADVSEYVLTEEGQQAASRLL